MNKPNNAKLIFAAMVFIGSVATADEHGHVHHQFAKETLIHSENVIPAQAGIHKNQQTGFPPARERRINQHLPKDVDSFHAVLAPVWHARPVPLILVWRGCQQKV